jgi:hypothetical protein
MQSSSQSEGHSESIERLYLQPLSLNLPFSRTSRSPKASPSFSHRRPQPLQSSRQNKTASLKTIAELKQILSRSLFYKKPPHTAPTQ